MKSIHHSYKADGGVFDSGEAFMFRGQATSQRSGTYIKRYIGDLGNCD